MGSFMSTPAANVTNTSGTFQFSPSLGETVLYSFGLCGVRRTALTQQHFEDARLAANMLLGRWSSDGVNLWQVDKICTPLVKGCGNYQVPTNTITILDAYVTIGSGAAEIDRIIMPVSRTEYASFANKGRQGFPSSFWFNRLLSPTIYLWPVPNGQQVALKYYRLRQTQDAELTNEQNVEIPVYFLEAFALGLAYRLALSWAPDKVPMLKPLADEAWALASKQNVENANIYLSPMMGGYYR
jgi:hypothetical protein